MLTLHNNRNRKYAVVFGGDYTQVGPACVTVLSLKTNSPEFYKNSDIYFFLSGTPDAVVVQILNLLEINLFQVTGDLDPNASYQTKCFGPGILAKFETLRLSSDYRRVIWSDSDQLFLGEIIGIVESLTVTLAIVDGGGGTIFDNFIDPPHPQVSSKFSLQPLDKYFKRNIVSNFIILNGCQRHLYELARNLFFFQQPNLASGDQGVWAQLMASFIGTWTLLPHEVYSCHPKDYEASGGTSSLNQFAHGESERMVKICHSYGRPKFWEGIAWHLYEPYYNDWLEIGGFAFKVKFKRLTVLERLLFTAKSNFKKWLGKTKHFR